MIGLPIKAPRIGLHPLVSLGLAVVVLSFGLAVRPIGAAAIYLAGLFALAVALGYGPACWSVLRFLLPAGLIVGGLTWLIGGSPNGAAIVIGRFLLFGLTTALAATIDPSDLSRALNRARCPRTVCLGFLITVRFIPVLKSEIQRIVEAIRIRGLKLSLGQWGRSYRLLLLPLVVRLVNISDTLALSLETRGFSAAEAPTAWRQARSSWRDWVAVVSATGLIGATAGRMWL